MTLLPVDVAASVVVVLVLALTITWEADTVPCLDCGAPGHRRRCPACDRAGDRARGSTAARGYGAEHQSARTDWSDAVDAGAVDCRRCGRPIEPGTPWDLGHPDRACPAPRAPEHRACNRATATRR